MLPRVPLITHRSGVCFPRRRSGKWVEYPLTDEVPRLHGDDQRVHQKVGEEALALSGNREKSCPTPAISPGSGGLWNHQAGRVLQPNALMAPCAADVAALYSDYAGIGAGKWLRGQDSNLRPSDYETDELTAALPHRISGSVMTAPLAPLGLSGPGRSRGVAHAKHDWAG